MALRSRASTWFGRWRGLLPLFVAEFIVWLGFGGLFPVLPLWVVDHGVDLATLGVIAAAWPIARLLGEPMFGWLADRTARKPLMIGGLLFLALFTVLQVWLVTPLAFFLLRGLAGIAASAYDPAARGFLSDSTPRDRQGEAFGIYGSFQMAGLILGPALGGLVAALAGTEAIFMFTAVATLLAAVPIALAIREGPVRSRATGAVAATHPDLLPEDPITIDWAATARAEDAEAPDAEDTEAYDRPRPTRLLNRSLVAATVIHMGENYAVGTYEVIWSLWLVSLGATIEFIGLTFALFGIPVLVLSPFVGRLVDRGRTRQFILVGATGMAVCGLIYARIDEPVLVAPVIFAEGICVALLSPSLFAVVASATPKGRSSTAQGLFGAAATMGFIVASLTTGPLAAADLRLPFYVFAVVNLVLLALGLLIGGKRLAVRRQVAETA